MDADTIAVAIAAILHTFNVEFRFKGEGTTFGPNATLFWNSIVVEAVHPKTLEYHQLHNMSEALKFVEGLKS